MHDEAFRFTLAADGPSDRCLLQILEWLLKAIPEVGRKGFQGQVANYTDSPTRLDSLADRLAVAVRLFPCHVLFVHRDAEAQPATQRIAEIESAVSQTSITDFVPVVPVRMTEAWLLISVSAIRRAADNAAGRVRLDIPPVRQLEQIADPKALLFDLLVRASEKSGRRLATFKRRIGERIQRVADLIGDFSPLRQLSAFQQLEQDTRSAVTRILTGDC